jgi:hypothetical protein
MRDGHADDSLELPFAAELLLAGSVIARENPALIAQLAAECVRDAWREKLSAAKRRVNTFTGEWVEEIGCVANEGGPG